MQDADRPIVRLHSVLHPEPQGQQLQQHLYGEESGEDHVEDVHDVAEGLGLLVVLQQREHSARCGPTGSALTNWTSTDLHSQCDSVEQNQDEHDVLEPRGIDDGPELVLNRVLGDVEFQRLSLQGVLHALTLRQRQTADMDRPETQCPAAQRLDRGRELIQQNHQTKTAKTLIFCLEYFRTCHGSQQN